MPSSLMIRAGRASPATGPRAFYLQTEPWILSPTVLPSRVPRRHRRPSRNERTMANDPGLAADTCIFMEAVSGDGGTHNSGGAWWLSPDIQLTGPTSGPDKADPGVANPVDVTLHNKGGDCKLPPGTESVTIELWAGNPSLAMAPNLPNSTVHIDSIG